MEQPLWEIQYKHPFYHKWVTDETASTLEEAYKILLEREEQAKGHLPLDTGILKWRIKNPD